MTKLLINEHPLIVLPTLAVAIGLNEAIILQQIHYWLDPKINKNIRGGKHWVYNTYVQWQEQFPFLSAITIRRAITSLEKKNLLISKHYNSNLFNQVKWYTINYEYLEKLEENMFCSKSTDRTDHFDHIESSERSDDAIKMIQSKVKETKTTTKISSLSKHNGDTELPNVYERDLLKIWDEIVEENKRIIKLTDSRTRILNKRFDNFFNKNVSEWKDFCLRIASSKFLMGEVTNFKVSLDWALKPMSIVKILDGDYGIGDRETVNKYSPNTHEAILSDLKKTNEPEFWCKIKKGLLIACGKDTYISWFSKLEFLKYDHSILELKVPSNFIAEYISQHHLGKIKTEASKILRDLLNVKLSVD